MEPELRGFVPSEERPEWETGQTASVLHIRGDTQKQAIVSLLPPGSWMAHAKPWWPELTCSKSGLPWKNLFLFWKLLKHHIQNPMTVEKEV